MLKQTFEQMDCIRIDVLIDLHFSMSYQQKYKRIVLVHLSYFKHKRYP